MVRYSCASALEIVIALCRYVGGRVRWWSWSSNETSSFVFNSHAINKMHKNELKCGGQNLWYITGQLLVGTVLYHQRQVDFVYGAHYEIIAIFIPLFPRAALLHYEFY